MTFLGDACYRVNRSRRVVIKTNFLFTLNNSFYKLQEAFPEAKCIENQARTSIENISILLKFSAYKPYTIIYCIWSQ